MINTDTAPVLLIALDAAEPRLIEQWIHDGSLPNLRHLYERGCYGRLASTADWLSGSPWPTFYTGTSPANHGLYHFLQWRANQMRLVRPGPDWLPLRPFWRNLTKTGRQVIAIDLPMTYPPEPFNGIEISGWGTHDRLMPPASYPPSLLKMVRREFGPPPLSLEVSGLHSVRSLFQLRDELIHATYSLADLAQMLMSHEKWDLFMVGFGATHRGGHKLWDLSSVLGDIRSEEFGEFSRALQDVYIACDAAIGQIVESTDSEVTIMVFSLHGMGPNISRADLLPIMLDRILAKEVEPKHGSEQESYLKRLRKLVPQKWRHGIKSRLPLSWQDMLTTFWRTGNIDFGNTSAISLITDLQGYIRINLRGRESAGIVEFGEDYERLCAEIAEGISTFVDADTGEPIVESVIRSDYLFTQGSRRDLLPDLIVRWVSSRAADHRAIISPRYGSIPWPTPGRNPDGRSGNHRPEGFLLAAGSGIRSGSRVENGHILDLAPTIYALLGVSNPTEMCGNVLSSIMK